MLTPQQKIDEIHSILVKMESRRRWKNIFSWLYRIVFLALMIIVIFFPNFLFGIMIKIATPIIEQTTKQIFDTQKENFSQIKQNALEKVKNLYP